MRSPLPVSVPKPNPFGPLLMQELFSTRRSRTRGSRSTTSTSHCINTYNTSEFIVGRSEARSLIPLSFLLKPTFAHGAMSLRTHGHVQTWRGVVDRNRPLGVLVQV